MHWNGRSAQLTGTKVYLAILTQKFAPFANFPTLFMGLVNADGELEMYDGKLRIVDAVGKIVADGLDSADYQEYIAEYVEPDSYLKSPYYRPLGYPDGIYRVGPLARMNIIDRCGTPIADQEWAEFRMLQRGAVLSSFPVSLRAPHRDHLLHRKDGAPAQQRRHHG